MADKRNRCGVRLARYCGMLPILSMWMARAGQGWVERGEAGDGGGGAGGRWHEVEGFQGGERRKGLGGVTVR